MIPIRLLFSLSVACSLLLTISITSVPEQNNVEWLRRTNRAIPDGLQDPYAGNDQTQEVIDNHHDVNSDLNTPKDVLHGSISAGKGARHEETMDSTENHTTISKVICKACNCSSSFDKSCFECCNATESHAKVASVGIAETHQDYVADSGTDSEENAKLRPEDNANFSFDKYSEIESKKPSVILDSNAAMKKVNVSSSHAEIICDACNCKKPFNRLCFQLKCCSRKEHERSAASSNSTSSTPAPNETVVTEDSEKNVTNNAIDLSKLKDHEENANFTLETHSEIVSEKPLPSKPATFDSDESNETGPVSNSSSTIFNSWTVIFICIITLTSLISAFKYAKQWRRNRMREDYLIDGLYSEARPLCLNDVLD